MNALSAKMARNLDFPFVSLKKTVMLPALKGTFTVFLIESS